MKTPIQSFGILSLLESNTRYGISPSQVHRRVRNHRIRNRYRVLLSPNPLYPLEPRFIAVGRGPDADISCTGASDCNEVIALCARLGRDPDCTEHDPEGTPIACSC